MTAPGHVADPGEDEHVSWELEARDGHSGATGCADSGMDLSENVGGTSLRGHMKNLSGLLGCARRIRPVAESVGEQDQPSVGKALYCVSIAASDLAAQRYGDRRDRRRRLGDRARVSRQWAVADAGEEYGPSRRWGIDVERMG